MNIVDVVIENYGKAYSNLVEKKDYIKKIILLEESIYLILRMFKVKI